MRGKQPFETVVTQHGATVLRVCRALLGVVDADDAWSETFLSALQAYPRLPEDANIEAWLVTIAHHKAIDAIRRSRRVTVAEALARGAANAAGTTGTSSRDLGSRDLGSRDLGSRDLGSRDRSSRDLGSRDLDLVRSLAALPEKQRFAVVYHYLVGLPYGEVAAIIGGSAEAARRAASDGVANLRKAEGATR
jgi:RNA polymerase sigma factor (sigma-70 family)